tara:strand:- start:8644 stop:8832 length:189 start_codon:yes stop_codon:yes gene_type:complete
MKKILIDQVDDGFNYFNGYRLEELKTDDVYYIEAFMKYIEVLESKLNVSKKLFSRVKLNQKK